MRTQTDYPSLSNRCSACGHRLLMHTPRCDVVTGDPRVRDLLIPCKCKSGVR